MRWNGGRPTSRSLNGGRLAHSRGGLAGGPRCLIAPPLALLLPLAIVAAADVSVDGGVGDMLAQRAGELEQLDFAYYVVHPKAKGRLPQVKAFIGWIEAEAQAHEEALRAIDNGAGI